MHLNMTFYLVLVQDQEKIYQLSMRATNEIVFTGGEYNSMTGSSTNNDFYKFN